MGEFAIENLVGKMMPLLDERKRSLFLGICAECLSRGGVTKLNSLTKISRVTITQGQKESSGLPLDPEAKSTARETKRSRAEGGGRKKLEAKFPTIKSELEKLLDGNTIGDPENPLCWTTKSVRNSTFAVQKIG